MRTLGIPQFGSHLASGRFVRLVFAPALLLLAGCSLLGLPRAVKNAPIQEAPRKFGTILRINTVHGFVLIQKDPSALLPEWEGVDAAPILCSNDPHRPNALLRISPESRRNLVIADILDGQPNLGDSVFIPAGSEKTPLPKAPEEEAPAAKPAGQAGQDG